MKGHLLLFVFGLIFNVSLFAQQVAITGKITNAQTKDPLENVTVSVKGGATVKSNSQGNYQLTGAVGQTIVFRSLGFETKELTIGNSAIINVALESSHQSIEEVEVVGALGITAQRRSFGTSVQTVSASDVADTRRENFINALQGRVAGLDVTSTSGVPGASSMMLLRGVSSINGNNQPLIVVDGLPVNNNTMATAGLASSSSTASSFENRGVDFTNRSSDFNPEDLESITVLKGPEAAALYGIEAANGAIVITTKRGKAGEARISYNMSGRADILGNIPEVQRVYNLGANGLFEGVSARYWGPKYEEGVEFFDNVDGFFRTPFTQNHNLSVEGGSNTATYRVSGAFVDQTGVVPNTNYQRINLTTAMNAKLKPWLGLDVSMQYSRADNDQVFKGNGGPLLGLLLWPQTDDAKNYLNADGSRRRYFTETGDEVDNPYFNVNKNLIGNVNNRIVTNTGLNIRFTDWLTLDSKFGFDLSLTEGQILRHPESNFAYTVGGRLDLFNNNQRNFSLQNVLRSTFEKGDFGFDIMLGQATNDRRGFVVGNYSERFLDPNFVSIDNSAMENRWSKQSLTRYRLVGVFGQFQVNYNKLLYLTVTGRNDWSSTLPVKNQSFFYPSANIAFNFSDLSIFENFEGFSGKLRGAIAQVGRDSRPYGIYPSLEFKNGAIGGYGYGFTAPNPDLKPEMATSMEFGTDLSFFNNRLGLEVTYFKKKQVDQIIKDIRASYATGFILKDMNGGETRGHGLEVRLYGSPIKKENFDWNTNINFAMSRNKVVALPADLPETYSSDTWLYGNVRNGNVLDASTMALTGYFFMRNNEGQLLINPTNGLPIRESIFVYAGHDRWPDFTIGLENSFRYKNLSLSFLLDIRKGGDVMNATEHYLTTRGLSMRTLDRDMDRVVKGVFRDGLENSSNPTQNNVVITPQYQNGYYTNMSEEFFIEKDINWLRMRDLRVSFALPKSVLEKQKVLKSASVFMSATDLFLITNYSGLDPVVNGNTAALGGGGGYGIDYGNFPMPIGLNFGVRVGF